MRTLLRTSAIACLALSSCVVNSEPAQCTAVDNGDGTFAITCPDGSSITVRDGIGCTVTDNGDGTKTIACGDGTTAVIRDGIQCAVSDNGDGTATIACDDGSSFVVTDGLDGSSCSVTDNGNGTQTIACDDGSMVLVADGAAGSSCTSTDNGNGTITIDCDDGSSVTVADGAPGTHCSVIDNGDGSLTISCPDGTQAIMTQPSGASCTVFDNGDGTRTILCPDGTALTTSAISPTMGMLMGDFTATNSADIIFLSSYNGVSGTLTIATSGNPFVGLPTLEHVGEVVLVSTDVEVLSMVALATADDIDVRHNASLTSLELPALTSLTNQLWIQNNALTAVTLPSLQTADVIFIWNNSAVASISFASLSTLGNEFHVEDHLLLTSLSAPALTSTPEFTLINNAQLATFSVPLLDTVSGRLWIWEHPALSTLAPLSSLANVGELLLQDNAGLTNLTGLGGIVAIDLLLISDHANLQSLAGFGFDAPGMSPMSLDLQANPSLASLTGVQGITRLTNLTLTNNGPIPDLAPLSAVTEITGDAVVDDLVNSLALPNLTTVGGDLTVSAPSSVTTLDLDVLATVTGTLNLSGFAGIDTVALPALTSTGSRLELLLDCRRMEAPLLVSSSAVQVFNADVEEVILPSFTDAAGFVSISGTGLKVIDMSSLDSTGGQFLLSGAPALSTLTLGPLTDIFRFEIRVTGLTSIDLPGGAMNLGVVEINNNAALTSVNFGGGNAAALQISNSPMLPLCDAEAAAAMLTISGGTGLFGLDLPCIPHPCGAMMCVKDCMQPMDYVCQ